MKHLALNLITLTILSFFVFTNCQAQKNQTKPSSAQTATVQNTKTKKLKFALVISFISHAYGIDGEKYDAIIRYISTHPKKPKYKLYGWGREGERDICMNLNELTKRERKIFINEIKKLADGSDRVFINLNVEKEFVLEHLKDPE